MTSWKCYTFAGRDPGGVVAAVVDVADAHSAVYRLSGSRLLALFAELLQPTAGIPTSDSVTLQLLRRHLLPLRYRFRCTGGRGR